MADPLSQLRQYHINQREIKELNGYIIFGDHGWPKNVSTNYQSVNFQTDDSKKEYYTLECLHYFVKNQELTHAHYVRQAGALNIPCVKRPDRKDLLAYLKGEIQTASGIDKNAPIPPLRLPIADIAKLGRPTSSAEPTASASSSQSSSHPSSQHDSSRGADGSNNAARKRPHDDPEMERARETFANRLNEPSTKKLATIIPTEIVDRAVTDTNENLAAISTLGPERLAAMRAKRQAVKMTSIADMDGTGSGATEQSNKEAELLIAMDSDHSKLIKSKEKIWRNRSSILQAQSKDFLKTVLPFAEALNRGEDPKKRVSSQPQPVPMDAQTNSSQSQQHPQQQATQRSTYNRYDQERFVKPDIGVEIDTKSSFVNNFNPTQPSNPAKVPVPTPTNGPSRPVDTIDSRHSSHHAPPHHRGSSHSNNNNQPPSSRHHSSQKPRPTKRTSTVPIIVIPATPTSIINMNNATSILQDHTYSDGESKGRRESEILIHRKRPDGTYAAYKIMDNPVKLDADDWNRVVAVFVQGPAWQFKGWPWGGSPVEIFARIKGFHLKWDEAKLDDNVAKWNVSILELSRSKRHMDKASLLKFWESLDVYMAKFKNFLKF